MVYCIFREINFYSYFLFDYSLTFINIFYWFSITIECFLVFTNINKSMMMMPIANAKRKVASGEILSQSIQRIYQPGNETIPIAV